MQLTGLSDIKNKWEYWKNKQDKYTYTNISWFGNFIWKYWIITTVYQTDIQPDFCGSAGGWIEHNYFQCICLNVLSFENLANHKGLINDFNLKGFFFWCCLFITSYFN